MSRSSIVLLAAAMLSPLISSSPASAQRPAKAPPAPVPAPAPRVAPIPRPAPAARPAAPDPFDLVGLIDPIDAADLAHIDIARVKAEAMASLARPEVERAFVEARAAGVQARAMADAQVAMNLDAAMLDGAMLEARVNAPLALAMSDARGRAWSAGYRTMAPEPWAQQDPADSLYREARKALSADQYDRAAELFRRIWRAHPGSVYTPDAYYWQAFSLQRQGGDRNLGEALASLETQQQKFPRAATLGDAKALRARIEGQLGRRGDQAVATTLRGRAERASDGCPRADEDERIEALNAVMQMDRDQALPTLKKVLARREPCTQELRRTAVLLIARYAQPDAAQALMGVAKNDPDPAVREQAIFWMANAPSDEVVDFLVDLAKRGDDLSLRKRAVYSLSRAKSTRARDALRQVVLDENQPEELRGEALMWLTNVAEREDATANQSYLRELFAKPGSVAFRERVLGVMTARRTEETRAFLVNVALDPKEVLEVRRAAVSYIGMSSRWGRVAGVGVLAATKDRSQAGTARAEAMRLDSAGVATTVTALSTVYEKVGEPEIKRAALSGLISIGGPGIDKLLDVARNEKNVELRRSAVSYLSRTKDPRALQLLQEIINK